MDLELAGKVALVTAASRGLGLASAALAAVSSAKPWIGGAVPAAAVEAAAVGRAHARPAILTGDDGTAAAAPLRR